MLPATSRWQRIEGAIAHCSYTGGISCSSFIGNHEKFENWNTYAPLIRQIIFNPFPFRTPSSGSREVSRVMSRLVHTVCWCRIISNACCRRHCRQQLWTWMCTKKLWMFSRVSIASSYACFSREWQFVIYQRDTIMIRFSIRSLL